MEVTSGWVQVLRGPRPRAEKWLSATQKRGNTEIPNSKPVERWRQPYVQSPETARERGPDPRHSSAGGTPACGQFGSSLTSNGGFPRSRGGCSEKRVVEGEAAQTRPLKEQLALNDAFIQRSQKRIASLEQERAEEQALLDKALVRHERLKQEVAAAEPVPAEVPMQESSTEVLFLRAKRWPNWKLYESRIQTEGPSTPQRACGCG